MRNFLIAAALAVGVIISPYAEAAEPPSKAFTKCVAWAKKKFNLIDDEAKKLCDPAAGAANVNQPVPVSPAFSVLGVIADKALEPKTPDELAASLLNGVDPNGNFQTGIAIDTSPYMLWKGPTVTLNKYQNSYATRLLARTQLSIATTKGEDSDDESQRLAIGLILTPWADNKADPRLNKKWIECIQGNIQEAYAKIATNLQRPRPLRPGEIEGPEHKQWKSDAKKILDEVRTERAKAKALNDTVAQGTTTCEVNREDARKQAWEGSAWTIGLAPSWFSKSGDLDDLDSTGIAAWTSLSYSFSDTGVAGIENLGKAIIHARYRTDEKIAIQNANGQFFDRDSFALSLRWQFGRPRLNFSLEGSLVGADNEGREDDTFYEFNAKAKYNIQDSNIWLTGAIGTTSEKDDGESTARFSLDWAFNDKNAIASK